MSETNNIVLKHESFYSSLNPIAEVLLGCLWTFKNQLDDEVYLLSKTPDEILKEIRDYVDKQIDMIRLLRWDDATSQQLEMKRKVTTFLQTCSEDLLKISLELILIPDGYNAHEFHIGRRLTLMKRSAQDMVDDLQFTCPILFDDFKYHGSPFCTFKMTSYITQIRDHINKLDTSAPYRFVDSLRDLSKTVDLMVAEFYDPLLVPLDDPDVDEPGIPKYIKPSLRCRLDRLLSQRGRE